MRISVILPSLVSQKMAPRVSTHSPVRRRRYVQRNSAANHGPATWISPALNVTSAWFSGTSFQYARIAAIPVLRSANGVPRKTASGANTAAIASTSPRSHPAPNRSSSSRYAALMAPNIRQSGTPGRDVWYTESPTFTPPRLEEDEPMLKRILATTAVLGLCALPLAAQGHAAAAGNEMTITGSVVDLNCHTTNGASGAGHKACAQACAKAGVPLGPLSSDGTVYPPGSSQPRDPQDS